jgi:transposase
MAHPSAIIKLKIKNAFNCGTSISQLVNIFGYHRNSISRWIKHSKYDPKFQQERKSGSGRPSKLSGKHGKKIIEMIKNPASKFGFETDFWTTGRIQKLCKDEIGIKVSRMAIYRTLKRYEQAYKTPEKRYYEASKIKQTIWVQDVLPRIIEIEKTKNAILYFEDESCIQLAPVLGKTWGKIGTVLTQNVTGNRGSVSAISAMTKNGSLVFNIHDSGKRFSSKDIIAFLTELLMHHKKRHIIVMMDQAPCHTSKIVKNFTLNQKRLNIFYLPPRSPEFNPAEKIWNHLKHEELKSHQAKNVKELKSVVMRKMLKMSKNKNIVKSAFIKCEKSFLYCN